MQNHIGQRLSFEGDRCTVRYHGKIEGKDGSWLGVEWDDEQKGKHDGSVNGHKYFNCQSSSPTAGSFIRPSRKSDPSFAFLEALKQKYALADAANDAIHISGKTVEEVGFGKIQTQLQKFQQLEIIVLDSRCICVKEDLKASQVNEIRSLQLQIKDLDLSRNLFEAWDDVLSICTSLKHLRSLNVAGNRFSDTTVSLTSKPAWQTTWQIESLSLANTLVSWEKIVLLAVSFQKLRSLDASSNSISRVLQPIQNKNIVEVDLASNLISSLKDVAPLSELLHLEVLSLRFNPLDDLVSGSSIRFRSLQRLDLTGTKLPGLTSIDTIPQVFPALQSLQTKNTPLAEINSATLHTIARLPKLLELNHSPISVEERQNAELFYLGTIVNELKGANNETEEANILLNHPMWNALCEKYGTPTVPKAASNTINPNALEARVTIFTFYLSTSSRDSVQRQQARKNELLSGESLLKYSPLQRNGSKTSDPGSASPIKLATVNSSAPTSDANLAKTIPDTPSSSDDSILEKWTSIPCTTSCYALQGIVGRLFGLPPPFTTTIRLFYETNEWDPVARIDGEDDGWSVSEDDDDEDDHRQVEERKERKKEKGKMVMRTEELVPSTRPVGDWVTGKTAKVKVVLV